jgi:hypothetical protein
MKATKITYWVSTGIIAAFTLMGAFFINSPEAIKSMHDMGLPEWFRYELSIAKPIGALILILPFFGKRIKEWAYVAFGIDFISAGIAHIWGDGMYKYLGMVVVFIVLLIVSYVTYHKLNDYKTLPKNY